LAGSATSGTTNGNLFERAVAWLSEQARYRRTLNELAALTDRELDDIGLARGEVEAVARRSARLA
jgi:uncharacterized protein YjiS (DUF1127 family)